MSATAVGQLPAWLTRVLFSPRVPAERLAALRVLVLGYGAVYLAVRTSALTDFSRYAQQSFAPIGVWSWLNAPLSSFALHGMHALALVSATAAVVGYNYRFSAPVYATLLLLITTYRNCWGMVFHTENLLVLHSLVLCLAPAADTFSYQAKNSLTRHARQALGYYAWPLFAVSLITVLSYWIAGFTKLKLGGLSWLDGQTLRAQIAFDALRKLETGSSPSPFAAWLVQHPALFPALAWLTLALELGAPLALVGGSLARVWCLVAFGFHGFVVLFMLIVFPYPLLGMAFASFWPLERYARPLLERLRRLRVAQDATSSNASAADPPSATPRDPGPQP